MSNIYFFYIVDQSIMCLKLYDNIDIDNLI